MIQETSKAAFSELPMADLQDKILKLLLTYPDRTNQELGAIINKDASTVSGVVRPLVKKGFLIEAKKRTCNVTGRTVIAWKRSEIGIPKNNFSQKHLEELQIKKSQIL